MWRSVQKLIECECKDHYEIIYFVTSDDKPYVLKSIGYLCATLYFDKYTSLRNGKVYLTYPIMIIKSFGVKESFQGQGLGDKILKYAIQDAKTYQTKHITLDDMSDNYRKKRNIYSKNGFYYLEENGPEMQLDLT
jgi:GNAT superfamily N-acetyltransferase